MRKRTLLLILCAILILLASTNAAAHSGGTDSNGGHRDEDDYHYHHGYPAHDHLDMDGDGDLDCPYNFNDKTGQNSGNSSGGSAYIEKPFEYPTETNETDPQKNTPFDPYETMGTLIAICICAPMVLALIFSPFNKKLATLLVFIAGIFFFLFMVLVLILRIIALFL